MCFSGIWQFDILMLKRPALSDENIIVCLQAEYELLIDQLAFLPLGADQNTAVYHLVADGGKSYFLKLRAGVFNEVSVLLPKFFSDQGIAQIIPPLATGTGQLWASLDEYKTILYPYVEGRDGYEVGLADRQWLDFGAALKRIHTASVPPALVRRIPREMYTSHWREMVKMFLGRVEEDVFEDPVASELVVILKARRAVIIDLIGRAEQLARVLQVRQMEYLVCHTDLHAGNLLIDPNGAFYIVDWDDPLLAPKERDLMFVGAGLLGAWRTPGEEESLFYQGYGRANVDLEALAYYRYERILVDIAVFCEQLLSTDGGGADRFQSLEYLKSNFLPNGTIELAYLADQTQI